MGQIRPRRNAAHRSSPFRRPRGIRHRRQTESRQRSFCGPHFSSAETESPAGPPSRLRKTAFRKAECGMRSFPPRADFPDAAFPHRREPWCPRLCQYRKSPPTVSPGLSGERYPNSLFQIYPMAEQQNSCGCCNVLSDRSHTHEGTVSPLRRAS